MELAAKGTLPPLGIHILLGESAPEKTGTVAVTRTRLNEPRRTGHSGSKTEELINETDFACRLTFPLDAMTAADHAHDFKPRQGRGGGSHRLEATRWTDQALERAMIRLKDVVQIFRGAVFDILRQQSLVLQAPDGLGIRR